MTTNLLEFNSIILLLFWLISIAFAAYIISHTASFFPKFIGSIARYYKNAVNYNVDYNSLFNRFKFTPAKKEGKKNHGRGIPFFNKR